MTTVRPGASSGRLWPFSGRSAGGTRRAWTSCWARPVAYFAPVAPDFAEAGELKDDNLAVTQRILDARGVPNGMAG